MNRTTPTTKPAGPPTTVQAPTTAPQSHVVPSKPLMSERNVAMGRLDVLAQASKKNISETDPKFHVDRLHLMGQIVNGVVWATTATSIFATEWPWAMKFGLLIPVALFGGLSAWGIRCGKLFFYEELDILDDIT